MKGVTDEKEGERRKMGRGKPKKEAVLKEMFFFTLLIGNWDQLSCKIGQKNTLLNKCIAPGGT